AEDGIRDFHVTGVQTCALPISQERLDIDIRKPAEAEAYAEVQRATAQRDAANAATEAEAFNRTKIAEANKVAAVQDAEAAATARSEERRVGKECRSAWQTELER